jgi:predicted nucleotide-binding protein (sugar kinase/HSP70/actin superfamily)
MPIKIGVVAMGKVIGIPRGLFYYKYFPLWQTFFEETGAEMAVSAETCRRVMDKGIAACVSEACLPVKAYFGHVLDLADKVDALFIPRYTSVSRHEFICPKFGGLPDMVRHSLGGLPELITPEVNMHDRRDGGLAAALETGRALGVGRAASRRAYEKAVAAYLQHRAGLVGNTLRSDKTLPKTVSQSSPDDCKLRILLLGHAYTVGDRFINMDIVRKLATLGAEAVTLEYYDGRTLVAAAAPLEKPLFWNLGTQALGCAHLLMERPNVDGVLHLTCFGCGLDSFVGYLFERRVRSRGIPFSTVSLDEHTGEAGMQTRLEAFTDTLRYRRADA